MEQVTGKTQVASGQVEAAVTGEASRSNVIMFPGSSQSAAVSQTGGVKNSPESRFVFREITKQYYTAVEEHHSILDQEVYNQITHDMFYQISDCIDPEVYSVERSNLFDAWKTSLGYLSRKDLGLTPKHRQIVGALLCASAGKDLNELSIEQIDVLIEATRTLRKTSLTKSDVKPVIKKAKEVGLITSLPLSPVQTPELSEGVTTR
jgi:hypothetical protein